jgi:hypothetical protein
MKIKNFKEFESVNMYGEYIPKNPNMSMKYNYNNGVFAFYDKNGNYNEIKIDSRRGVDYNSIKSDLVHKGYTIDDSIGVYGSNRT